MATTRKRDKTTEGKETYADKVAGKVIEMLQQGTAPWMKPWQPGELASSAPMNPTTGNNYRGSNSLWLAMQGMDDPRWLTYNQAAAMGAQVRKGEKGAVVQYAKFTDDVPVRDASGAIVKDSEGKTVTRSVELERPKVFSAVVFNAQQIDGMPALTAKEPLPEWQRHERAEAILASSGVPIRHEAGDRAYYSPGSDTITLPERDQFPSPDGFYATALHELGHATGHASRLNRDLSSPFGSEGYAREELRAELASLMIGQRLEMGHDPGNHVAYVGSWIKALQEDPREIFRAAADAEKIAGFVMGIEQKQDQVINQQLSPAETLAALRTKQLQATLDGPSKQEDAPIANRYFTLLQEAQRRGGNDEVAATQELASIEKDYAYLGAEMLPVAVGFDLRTGTGFGASTRDVPASIAGAMLQAIEEPAELQAATRSGGADASNIHQPDTSVSNTMKLTERKNLSVAFKDKDKAKAVGAKWDKEQKTWFAPPGTDATAISAWLPSSTNPVVATNKRPEAAEAEKEFAQALTDAGLILKNGPIMDGTRQRVPVEGDKGSEKSGSYIGHLDGYWPAGTIENLKTSHKEKWKASGTAPDLSDVDRQRLREESAERLAQREREQAATHKRTAVALETLFSIAPITATHPYLAAKGVEGHVAMVPADGSDLPDDSPICIARSVSHANELRKQDPAAIVLTAGDAIIPIVDIDNKLMTAQTISPGGFKSMVTGGKLAGGMHRLDYADSGKGPASPIVVVEGFATGLSVGNATRATVVVAFNANNLVAVGKALHAAEPARPILFGGDNDHVKAREIDERTGLNKPNAGLVAATAAAAAVNGHAAVPQFVDPNSKGSDWNDLAREEGTEELQKQMTVALLLADRRRLADAQQTGHDAERINQDIVTHQAAAEQAVDQGQGQGAELSAAADVKTLAAGLRNASDKEVDAQDKSDELGNGQPELEDESAPELVPEQAKTRGRKRTAARGR